MAHFLRFRLLRVLVLVLMLALVSTACGPADDPVEEDTGDPADEQDDPDPDDDAEAADEDAPAAIVVDNSFVLTTADPGRQWEPTGHTVARALYDTLFTFEEGDVSEPVPLLVDDYEISDDAQEFTFTLRDDAVFSDGSPVTAADVEFSLLRQRNLLGSGSFLLEDVEDITATGEREVVITTTRPMPVLLAILASPALGILNSEAVLDAGGSADEDAAQTDEAESFLNSESAGSGPFVLESFSTESQVVFTRNENYWGDPPAFERIVLRNVETETQRLNIQTGESDLVLDLVGDELEQLDTTGLQVSSHPAPDTWILSANADPDASPTTASVDFWEGVRYALDYEALRELAGPDALLAPGVIGQQYLGALPIEETIDRDLDRAAEALERSGAAGETVALTYPSDITFNGMPFEPVAERAQAQLREAGMDVVLDPAPIQTFLERDRAGDTELALSPNAPNFPDPEAYLTFVPGRLHGERAGWHAGADPEIEQMASDAQLATDDEEREELYQEWQRALSEGSPFFPLFQPAEALVAKEQMTGVVYNSNWRISLAELGWE